MKLEVRCCCDANKLFGWLKVSEMPKAGQYVICPILKHESFVTRLDATPASSAEVIYVQLKASAFAKDGSRFGYIALSDEHVGIETLRKIRGFKENR